MAKRKRTKDKQRSTKHTYKTKDRVTRTSCEPEGELRWSGRVSRSCSTSGTHRVILVTNYPDNTYMVFNYDLKSILKI